MDGKKNEKIKFYLVIGLAVVLLISVFFRIIKPKLNRAAKKSTYETSPIQYTIPEVETVRPQDSGIFQTAVIHDSPETAIRDIFQPSRPLSKEADKSSEPEAPRPTPSLKLRGTIVGEKDSIALIDGELFHTGDWIGGFQIITIGKKEVLLDSGAQQIKLEILKNEK
jgi:hypothetical protein